MIELKSNPISITEKEFIKKELTDGKDFRQIAQQIRGNRKEILGENSLSELTKEIKRIYLEEKRALNRIFTRINGPPYPFLKWAGGKRQMLSQIDPLIPASFENYIEPFLGGGALFYYFLPERACLLDNNPVLINVYLVIQSKVEELIQELRTFKKDKEFYYKIRNIDREEEFNNWTDVKKAARTIFLNKTCYNGLYRVNSKGQFNVPYGKYKNPTILDEENLREVHKVLQGINILTGSFEICLKYAKSNDFIYMDPPYHPISDTSNFTSYTKDNFSDQDQIRLKEVVDELSKRKCKVLLSNSYCKFILDLYDGYEITSVTSKRAINSDATKRGAIKEVLVRNYDIE